MSWAGSGSTRSLKVSPVTIILSLIHAQYALQISDRQLSEEKQPGQYEAWDRASNKSVILLGHDGLISMGYSGPAFISGATTDGWIAEVVAERTMGANRPRPDFGIQLGEGVPDRAVLHASEQRHRPAQ